MHRHGYKGRKFGRERDERNALMKGLAGSLFENASIETTLPKAKELRPYAEKLITRAKKANLFNRRLLIARLGNVNTAHILVDQIAPQLTKRESGYLRITKTNLRKGDNTQMARVSFVDDITLKSDDVDTDSTTKLLKGKKTQDTKAVKPSAKSSIEHKSIANTKQATVATKSTRTAKRTGVRGNK